MLKLEHLKASWIDTFSIIFMPINMSYEFFSLKHLTFIFSSVQYKN